MAKKSAAATEREQAKWSIIREWDNWAPKNNIPAGTKGTGTQAMLFFTYLQKERAELLHFKSGGVDKWQTVHGWLSAQLKVKD